MSDSRIFPEGVGKSSDDVDSFLDELATDQHPTNKPKLDDADNKVVSGWQDELSSSSTGEDARTKSKEALSTASEKSQEVLSSASDKGQEAVSTAKEKVSDISGQAQSKADDGMTKAGDGIGHAADTVRQHGEDSSGAMSTAATTAADKLDSAGSYLREKGTDDLLKDLEDLIRRKPTESLLVAAGAGFVLSKLLG